MLFCYKSGTIPAQHQSENLHSAWSHWRKLSVPIRSFRYPTLYEGSFDIQGFHVKQESYWPLVAYNQSKLCNMLCNIRIKLVFVTIWCYCNVVHPGNYLSVNIARNSNILRLLNLMTRPFSRSTVSLIDVCLIDLCN